MTFYEAAIQILLRTGHPLHAREIAEIAVRENLLSHVGKAPEVTMASRLAAMARRSQDRRLVAVDTDTFGLTDWSVEASPEALEKSGLPEVHDESEPPLRERERHPKVDKDNVRVAGRGDRRRRHEEGERDRDRKKKKRLGPVPEYVFELLGRIAIPVPLFELAAAVREKDLVADDLGREALGAMLASENERREEEGRRPLFALYDDGFAGLQGGQPPSGEAQDYPALVAKAVARLAEDRKAPVPAAAVAPAPARLSGAVERAVAEQRQRTIRQLRRRLAELETQALEAVVSAMLDAMGYADLRVAKRHKDGALFTTRRRMGLSEVRFAIRVIRGNREVRREDVVELRKDMISHSAQMGVLVSPSDVTREAKNEASQATSPLVTLLCADALADQMAERGVGVATRTVTFVDLDEAGLRALQRRSPAADADASTEGPKRSDSAAEERRERRDRERKEWRERRELAREERRRQRLEAEAATKGEEGEGSVSTEEGATSAESFASAEETAASGEAGSPGETTSPEETAAHGSSDRSTAVTESQSSVDTAATAEDGAAANRQHEPSGNAAVASEDGSHAAPPAPAASSPSEDDAASSPAPEDSVSASGRGSSDEQADASPAAAENLASGVETQGSSAPRTEPEPATHAPDEAAPTQGSSEAPRSFSGGDES